MSKSTHFNRSEIMRLIQLYYMLTKKRDRIMDRMHFIQFMDVFLGFRHLEAVEKIYILRCTANKKYLTEQEFVETLSLLLKGTVPQLIKLCFDVYTEMARSPLYIKKEDVFMIARKNTAKMSKSSSMEKYDQQFTEYVMQELDKDRDNRISEEDYRTAVNENIVWLQFLGPVVPASVDVELFLRMFTARPYVNNIQIEDIRQQNQITTNKKAGNVRQTQSSSKVSSNSIMSFFNDDNNNNNMGNVHNVDQANNMNSSEEYLTLFK